MIIINNNTLQFDAVKVIRFVRFTDERGYFTEHHRRSDFKEHQGMRFLKGIEFVQANESFSRPGTVRGLHFQWIPYMGKLVRAVTGRVVEMILDIRRDSPTFGKIICYDMIADCYTKTSEWIWVPTGFAHGNYFTGDTLIEYFCSGEYNNNCEAGISQFAKDID